MPIACSSEIRSTGRLSRYCLFLTFRVSIPTSGSGAARRLVLARAENIPAVPAQRLEIRPEKLLGGPDNYPISQCRQIAGDIMVGHQLGRGEHQIIRGNTDQAL